MRCALDNYCFSARILNLRRISQSSGYERAKKARLTLAVSQPSSCARQNFPTTRLKFQRSCILKVPALSRSFIYVSVNFNKMRKSFTHFFPFFPNIKQRFRSERQAWNCKHILSYERRVKVRKKRSWKFRYWRNWRLMDFYCVWL